MSSIEGTRARFFTGWNDEVLKEIKEILDFIVFYSVKEINKKAHDYLKLEKKRESESMSKVCLKLHVTASLSLSLSHRYPNCQTKEREARLGPIFHSLVFVFSGILYGFCCFLHRLD